MSGGRRELPRCTDSEGITHYVGAAQCVNVALCGNNDDMRDLAGPVDCRACLAQINHIYAHRRPGR